MRTLPVRLSESARIDLDGIARWLAADGATPPSIRRYIGRIRRRYARVGLAPFSGQARIDLGPEVRSVPFERSASIVYRVESERVLILRILRRGRDVDVAFTR